MYIVHLSVCNAGETLGKSKRNSSNLEFSWPGNAISSFFFFLRGVNEENAEFIGHGGKLVMSST